MYIVSTLWLEEKYRTMLEKECGVTVEHVDKIADLSEEQLKQVEILLTYGYDMPAEVVQKMESLRWIHSGQAGIDTMPMDVLQKMGVRVTNSRGINSITIAEYVVCMLLNLERNTYSFYEAYKQKEWDMNTRLDEMEGKSITILGLGNVGLQIAKRVKAFDLNVVGVDLNPVKSEYIDCQYRPEQLPLAVKDCDYLVVSMPLTAETYHMIDTGVLKEMKETAVVMNVGRGPIVNTDDLVDALKNHRIRAAILDVLEEEPVPPESSLWDVENLMITPHIAGDRQKSYMPRMMRILCDNLNQYPDFDKMKNPVNLTLGF
ncbi:MAG: D-2-hydroxyacid dehydrogenase [Clostridiales bacterium]|nr:D-2-hydroxyacid dehydrogenase [Clostridiales bacterium]